MAQSFEAHVPDSPEYTVIKASSVRSKILEFHNVYSDPDFQNASLSPCSFLI